jgi:hypothetical protein
VILSTAAAVNVELGARAFFDMIVDKLAFKSWAKIEAPRNDELRV